MTKQITALTAGFWAWSLRAYQREGVKDACLAFQGAGGDVNVGLWCCWLAARGRAPSPDAITQAAGLSEMWQASVLTPLRSARDGLKSPPIWIDAEGASEARADLLDIELEIERLEQEALESLATEEDLEGPPAARANRALLSFLAARQTGTNATAESCARGLIDTVFTQALYTLTRVSPSGHGTNGGHHTISETLDEAALRAKLGDLLEEHRALDAAVKALGQTADANQLKVARLKKRKLQLKDEIATIEDALNPDIIA